MSLKATSEAALAAAKGTVANVNVTSAITAGAKTASQGASQAGEWAWANPLMAMGAAAIGVGATAVVAPMAVASPVLGAAGFASGVVKGSIAAGVQSGIGNVVASSAFATLQSAGAGGYGVAVVSSGVQAAGGVIGTGGAAVIAWVNSKAGANDTAGASDAQ